MGKISVDAFLREYNVTAKQKGSAMETFIKKHITTSYVDFVTKNTYCTAIVKATCYVKDGDREFVKINSVGRYIHFIMRLIDLYTDIEINAEDLIDDYDKLTESGVINDLINGIPETEYSEFSTILNMMLGDLRDNEYSITAILYNLKNSLSISEEIINTALAEIKKSEESNN